MDTRKSLFVAGSFDDDGGRFSKLADIVFQGVGGDDIDYMNGGDFSNLQEKLDSISDYKLIYWFANVPNDKEKVVRDIKKNNRACVLVTSKRNVEKNYDLQDLIYHALGLRCNLFVEFTKVDELYRGRVLDPLGNMFLDYNEDFGLVGKVLSARSERLLQFTRKGSSRIGDKLEVPNEEEFFEIVKGYADRFHELIHANPAAANRFLGNASFRGDKVYVSRRNFDKRFVDKDSFVAVEPGRVPVEFYGDNKPSVDTPVQVMLYEHFENVKYMLHSHVYVKNVPFTVDVVPCGALEEVAEITHEIPYRKATNFAINLRGHGSIVFSDNVDMLRNVDYVAKPSPEEQKWE